MQKFATSMILRPVLLQEEKALVGVVEDLIIDTDTGILLGLLVREGFGKKNQKALAQKDIVGIGQNFFLVKSYSVLGEIDEFVRLKRVIDRDIKILKNKVYTESGVFLGKVYDFTLDLTDTKLSKIYVRPSGIRILSNDLIISSKQIISIEKDKIVVEDTKIKDKVPAKAKSAPELAS